MLQQRQQFDRRAAARRRRQRQAEQGPRRRLGERQARRIVGLDVPAAQFGRHPPRQHPVGRHQRDGLVLAGQRAANGDRDRQRLLALVRRLDQRQPLDAGRQRRDARPLRPAVGGLRRAHRLRQEGGARRRRLAPRPRPGLGSVGAEPDQQLLQRELRMAGGQRLPARRVEPGIEPVQHHRAGRQSGDDPHQIAARVDAPRRARDNERRGGPLALQPRGIGADQAAAPFGRVHAAVFFEDLRPLGGDQAEKGDRLLPVLRQIGGRQPGDGGEVRVLVRRLVDQPRQRPGKGQRHGEAAGRSRVLAERRHALGEDQFALQARHLGRQGAEIGLRVDQPLVLVDIAERHDARQHDGVEPRSLGQLLGERARGAAGGQEDGHAGQRQRIARRAEAVHQARRQIAEKRPSGRDGEQPVRAAAHRAALRRHRPSWASQASASSIASGVLISSQSPSSRWP